MTKYTSRTMDISICISTLCYLVTLVSCQNSTVSSTLWTYVDLVRDNGTTTTPRPPAVPVVQVHSEAVDKLGIVSYGKEAAKRFWAHTEQNPADDWTGFYLPQFSGDFGDAKKPAQPFASQPSSNTYSFIAKPDVDVAQEKVMPSRGPQDGVRSDTSFLVPVYQSFPTTHVLKKPERDMKELDSSSSSLSSSPSASSASKSSVSDHHAYDNQQLKHEPLHINNTNPVVYDKEAIDRSRTDYLSHSPLSKHDAFDNKIHAYQYIFGEGPSQSDGRLHSYETTNEYHYPTSKVNQYKSQYPKSGTILKISYGGTNYDKPSDSVQRKQVYRDPYESTSSEVYHRYPTKKSHSSQYSRYDEARKSTSMPHRRSQNRRKDYSYQDSSKRRPEVQQVYSYHSPKPSETHGYEFNLDVSHTGAGKAKICHGLNCRSKAPSKWPVREGRGQHREPRARGHSRPSPPKYRGSKGHSSSNVRATTTSWQRDHRAHQERSWQEREPAATKSNKKRPLSNTHDADHQSRDHLANRYNSDDHYESDYSDAKSTYHLPKPRTYYGPYGKHFPGYVTSHSRQAPVVRRVPFSDDDYE
ncbi:hypothetical protein HDE_08548 [Halotydeus destructor]|nr:hypothetical protein HDE_08548 [Halotydeus destructor]